MAKRSVRGDMMRQAIAREAARLMIEHGHEDYGFAKRKAAERFGVTDLAVLPKNTEIEEALAEHQRLFVPEAHASELSAMRSTALEAMRLLAEFEPRLVGPLLSGTATAHNDITLHLFADTPETVAVRLIDRGIPHEFAERRLRTQRDEVETFPAVRFTAGRPRGGCDDLPARRHPPGAAAARWTAGRCGARPSTEVEGLLAGNGRLAQISSGRTRTGGYRRAGRRAPCRSHRASRTGIARALPVLRIGQVRQRDSDPVGELGQRHPPVVKLVVELDGDRHVTPSFRGLRACARLPRTRGPARTCSRTASQPLIEKPARARPDAPASKRPWRSADDEAELLQLRSNVHAIALQAGRVRVDERVAATPINEGSRRLSDVAQRDHGETEHGNRAHAHDQPIRLGRWRESKADMIHCSFGSDSSARIAAPKAS